MATRFHDRAEAGRLLARHLQHYADRSDVVALALPRGGVPVGYEVAHALTCPLDVFLVRKLGVPGQEELAMGAIASGGTRVLNEEVITELGISKSVVAEAVRRQQEELGRQERLYRGDRSPIDVRGKIVLVIDDGLATGSSMRAAVRAIRQHEPARIVVAVPTAAASTCDDLRREVDEVVSVITPEVFYAVGLWYQDFSQTTDEQVRDLLNRSVHV